ncbi:MAG TPA: hypothetical protein VN372_12140 [Methanospirillum sp.]|nr:hypothetical protein [Methanospirillum sp.]
MNILLISRPEISLYRELRQSETAWDAIRFYDPIIVPMGVFIPVSTFAGAITLASDLRYFLRKYTVDHLFQLRQSIYCTAGLSRSRYLNRDCGVTKDWQYRMMYWFDGRGILSRYRSEDWNSEEIICDMPIEEEKRDRLDLQEPQGGHLIQVWCTKPEYESL